MTELGQANAMCTSSCWLPLLACKSAYTLFGLQNIIVPCLVIKLVCIKAMHAFCCLFCTCKMHTGKVPLSWMHAGLRVSDAIVSVIMPRSPEDLEFSDFAKCNEAVVQ